MNRNGDTPVEREMARVDREALEAHVDELAGLTRVSGTDDEWTAAEYVVDQLRDYGVDATLHEFDGYVSVPESASVEMTTPTNRRFEECITTAFGATTPADGVHGPVVAVPDADPGTLEREDVAGKVVLLEGLPSPGPVGRLESAGAAAAVFESPSEDVLHEMIVTPVWGTPGTEDAAAIPDLPVVEVSRDAGEWLRARVESGAGEDEAVEATVRTRVRTEVATLPCPVGRIDGRESDRFVLVGNHVDSWHEGVTDNATAVAASLELARLFAEREPRRGVVFGFWSGHSFGRYAGSAWYADERFADLRDNGVAYLHLDLNGLRGAETLWYQHMAGVEDVHLDVLSAAPGLSLPESVGDDSLLGGDRPGRNSDQSFWGAGLLSLLSGARLPAGTPEGGPVGGGWWWHTPADTRDKVDLDVLVEETGLYAAIVARFCEAPVMPVDHVATARELRSVLDDVAAESAVDFDRLAGRVDDLVAATERAADRIASGPTDDPAFLAAVEDVQVTLSNHLVPALYKSRPDAEHDPALPQDRLPGLRISGGRDDPTGRNRLFVETSLRRQANRVDDRVRRATAAVERFLEETEGLG